MIPLRRITPVVVVLSLLAFATSLEAQVRVDLQLPKREFVAYEPVEVILTLTNRTGGDLLIHGEGVGRAAMSWLDFSVTNSRGSVLSPIGQVGFNSVRLPAGQSVAKTIQLNNIYRVADLGNYSCTAIVRLPGDAGVFKSNRTSFSVTKGTPLYRQRFGSQAARNVREFTVSLFNASDRSSLYVHLVDVRTGRNLHAFKLGDVLTFNKPEVTMDGKNNLHVLFLQAPGVFAHARVDPNGKYLGTEFLKRGGSAKPAFQTFANGEVVVAAGIPFNPQAEQEQQAQIRRLSERPAITYR
jgi:hypothetical protein